MNNCGNCKHWEQPSSSRFYSQANQITGQCLRIKMRDEVTEWKDIDGVKTDVYKDGEIVYVADGSGYWAGLCPTADFGCVLWEAK